MKLGLTIIFMLVSTSMFAQRFATNEIHEVSIEAVSETSDQLLDGETINTRAIRVVNPIKVGGIGKAGKTAYTKVKAILMWKEYELEWTSNVLASIQKRDVKIKRSKKIKKSFLKRTPIHILGNSCEVVAGKWELALDIQSSTIDPDKSIADNDSAINWKSVTKRETITFDAAEYCDGNVPHVVRFKSLVNNLD